MPCDPCSSKETLSLMDARSAKTAVEVALVSLFEGRSFLNGGSLLKRVSKKSGCSLIDVQQEFAALARKGILNGVQKNGFPDGRVSIVGLQKEACPLQQVWAATLKQRLDQLTEHQIKALRTPGETLITLTPDDQLRLLDGLLELSKNECRRDQDRYIVSAKYLLGSSKIVNNLSQDILNAFDLSFSAEDRLLYVITAGPSHPESIVFIENPSSFSSFSRSKLADRHMAICAYGYGLTFENFGDRLSRGTVIACPAVGQPPLPNLAEVIESVPLFFWGDLDLEGLRIYEAMKRQFSTLKLSRAYELMTKCISDPRRSHPYGDLVGKKSHKLPAAEEREVRFLSEICRDRAVDQEAICDPWPGEVVIQPFKADGLLL